MIVEQETEKKPAWNMKPADTSLELECQSQAMKHLINSVGRDRRQLIQRLCTSWGTRKMDQEKLLGNVNP